MCLVTTLLVPICLAAYKGPDSPSAIKMNELYIVEGSVDGLSAISSKSRNKGQDKLYEVGYTFNILYIPMDVSKQVFSFFFFFFISHPSYKKK